MLDDEVRQDFLGLSIPQPLEDVVGDRTGILLEEHIE
jgi:hypothetical protein